MNCTSCTSLWPAVFDGILQCAPWFMNPCLIMILLDPRVFTMRTWDQQWQWHNAIDLILSANLDKWMHYCLLDSMLWRNRVVEFMSDGSQILWKWNSTITSSWRFTGASLQHVNCWDPQLHSCLPRWLLTSQQLHTSDKPHQNGTKHPLRHRVEMTNKLTVK